MTTFAVPSAPEEIEAVQHKVADKDPWTQQTMVNPVRNLRCGHHYEQSSIAEQIRRRYGVNCPYPGCSNKLAIKTEDLVVDEEFKKQLESQKFRTPEKKKNRLDDTIDLTADSSLMSNCSNTSLSDYECKCGQCESHTTSAVGQKIIIID